MYVRMYAPPHHTTPHHPLYSVRCRTPQPYRWIGPNTRFIIGPCSDRVLVHFRPCTKGSEDVLSWLETEFNFLSFPLLHLVEHDADKMRHDSGDADWLG
jgi:hypothetical protein